MAFPTYLCCFVESPACSHSAASGPRLPLRPEVRSRKRGLLRLKATLAGAAGRAGWAGQRRACRAAGRRPGRRPWQLEGVAVCRLAGLLGLPGPCRQDLLCSPRHPSPAPRASLATSLPSLCSGWGLAGLAGPASRTESSRPAGARTSWGNLAQRSPQRSTATPQAASGATGDRAEGVGLAGGAARSDAARPEEGVDWALAGPWGGMGLVGRPGPAWPGLQCDASPRCVCSVFVTLWGAGLAGRGGG